MDECIEGTGRWLHSGGYLIVGSRGSRNLYAHRVAYEEAYGSIPPGLHVHHACGNKRCVNAGHMEVLSASDHQRRHRRDCGHDPSELRLVGKARQTRCYACQREKAKQPEAREWKLQWQRQYRDRLKEAC